MAADIEPFDTLAWTATRIADTLKLDRRRVAMALQDVEPCGTKGTQQPLYRLHEAVKAIFEPAGRANGDPNKLPPRERRDWYESEKIRLIVEKENRTLVSIEEYCEEMARILKALATFLETLPDDLERRCGLPPEGVEAMQRLIDQQRTALAERLTIVDEPEVSA